MAKITFHATIHEDDDGSYWAEVDELPGCFASSFSLDELRSALAEAIRLCLPTGIEIDDPEWEPLEQVSPDDERAGRRMLVCA